MAGDALPEGNNEYVFAILSAIYSAKLVSVAAVLELGALIGALIAGVFTNRYSRGTSIFTACSKNNFYAELASFYVLRISCLLSRFCISVCGN